MKWTEIPLLEYIDTYEMQCDVYVHTKDQRVIGLRDVMANPHLDSNGLYVEHSAFGIEFSFFIPREDFSHIEYRYVERERDHKPITKEDFDELNSFVEEQFEDYEPPAESLTEPKEGLFEDLI